MTTTVIDPTLTPTTIHVYEAIRQCWIVYGEAPSQYNLQVAWQIERLNDIIKRNDDKEVFDLQIQH